MELYLSAGQLPDTGALHLPRGAVSLPLALAASRGHCEVRVVGETTCRWGVRYWPREGLIFRFGIFSCLAEDDLVIFGEPVALAPQSSFPEACVAFG